MQESFWWWQCSDRYIISLSLPPPPYLPSLFSPSLISLMVSVDVKHHVYLLTDLLCGHSAVYRQGHLWLTCWEIWSWHPHVWPVASWSWPPCGAAGESRWPSRTAGGCTPPRTPPWRTRSSFSCACSPRGATVCTAPQSASIASDTTSHGKSSAPAHGKVVVCEMTKTVNLHI